MNDLEKEVKQRRDKGYAMTPGGLHQAEADIDALLLDNARLRRKAARNNGFAILYRDKAMSFKAWALAAEERCGGDDGGKGSICFTSC